MLNGSSRIDLVDDKHAGDLQKRPENSFQTLFQNNSKRLEVRRIVNEAFGSHLVIDPTNPGHLRIRLSKTPPSSSVEEQGLHQEARTFHANAPLISEFSDGVKAFTGIVTEIIAGDPSILLIDEPEAFLHPSLSFKLGKEIAKTSLETDKRVFVSTHSSNFVMGCIQSGAPVNIVRLTYQDGVATARVLPNEDILKLMRNPLLRSTGVLSALFYEHVVVTEADADRAFYQEINERLLYTNDERGIPNCLFLNAQGKDSIHKIIAPLRELGIPAAGVFDIDMIKKGTGSWKASLASGFVPELQRDSFSNLRAKIDQALTNKGDMKSDGGVDLLDGDDREAADHLLNDLQEYGLFLVKGGELESWLKPLGVLGHGPDWLIQTFEKMGEDPNSPTYLKPIEGDVWSFIGQVKQWLTDAKRKGIPT